MNRPILMLLAGALLLTVTACNTMGRQPRLENAMVTPRTLYPEDTAIVTVRLADPENVVDQLIATVREDPRIQMRLNDSGEGADETAGDHVWTLEVKVPPLPPAGDWTLDITAYDAGGNVVIVRTQEGSAAALQTSASVAIRYPEELAVPEE